MRLESYLEKHSISIAEFARQIGAKSRATVYRYAKGVRVPDENFIVKIHNITRGEVTANDFYDLPKLNGKRNGKIHD